MCRPSLLRLRALCPSSGEVLLLTGRRSIMHRDGRAEARGSAVCRTVVSHAERQVVTSSSHPLPNHCGSGSSWLDTAAGFVVVRRRHEAPSVREGLRQRNAKLFRRDGVLTSRSIGLQNLQWSCDLCVSHPMCADVCGSDRQIGSVGHCLQQLSYHQLLFFGISSNRNSGNFMRM